MRLIPLLALAALSTGITACGTKTIVTVPVATDSRIFQGSWVGTPKRVNAGAAVGEVRINAAATYVSSTSYTITGTLALDGKTYTLQGKAQASGGAQLTPQWSPSLPIINWAADVLQGTQKVGVLSSGMTISKDDPKLTVLPTMLTLGNDSYDLELNRTAPSTTP